MTVNGLLQIALYLGVLVLLVKPLGLYMARVFTGERTLLDPALRPLERLIYRISGVDPRQEQHWTAYTAAMLVFNLAGMVLLYALQRLQHVLPLNPQGFGPPAPDSAFNTAVSFTSNTNWQSYAGESTMSYLSQMAGLTVQNFVSAATGIALAIALIRAFARSSKQTLGNFWADLVRTTLWVLLPLSLVLALGLVWQGLAAEPTGVRRHHHGGGRLPDDRAGAGGLAARHQAARHQRRRLL
jgi:K+-transporting ATPase ATPase A chain